VTVKEQVVDYCLNPNHPRGKDKARVFASVLNITLNNEQQLADLVQQAAVDGEVTKETTTAFGQYYRVDWTISLRGQRKVKRKAPWNSPNFSMS
jgi:hypothetical protein